MVSTRSRAKGAGVPDTPDTSPKREAPGVSGAVSSVVESPILTQNGPDHVKSQEKDRSRKRKGSETGSATRKHPKPEIPSEIAPVLPTRTRIKREIEHEQEPPNSAPSDTDTSATSASQANRVSLLLDSDADTLGLSTETDPTTASVMSTTPSTFNSRPGTPSVGGPGSVSIISQSITSLSPSPHPPSDESDNPPKKRKYKIDRENIKINKRIMSKDTEEVIKMFKKFDDEVLTNPDAKSRLLSLGFETRKRYITTFKHFIRFCCKKNLDNFFVTGELMKEFYEEQFEKSSSNKPVIRLRKMDPAFSKLQEINFMVYGLENKDIPNRQVALDYLIYKETGSPAQVKVFDVVQPKPKVAKAPEPVERSEPKIESPPAATPIAVADEKKVRKKTVKKDVLVSFLKTSFCNHKEDLNNSVRQSMEMIGRITGGHPQVMEVLSSLMGEVNGSSDRFYYDLCNGPDMSGNGQVPPPPAPVEAPEQWRNAKDGNKIPIIDMNHDIYTIYELLEEWYVKSPSIVTRVQNWGTSWIRDEIDQETYEERAMVVEFVDRLCKECNEPDKFVMANDCDRYIRDQSILDEFITEIELDVETLIRRITRYRKKNKRV